MLFILSSCLPSLEKSSLVFDGGAISTESLVADGEPVTFEVLKQKLLTPHCIACHRGAASEENVLDWVTEGKPEESDLYRVIKDGSMPKRAAALDSRYLDLVVRYIESVKATEVPSTPTAPTTPVASGSFEEIKQKILVPHCLKCHEDVDNEKALMGWITPTKPEESPFYVSIKSGDMPQDGSPLSEEELLLVEKYITSMKPNQVEVPATSFAEIKANILAPKCLECHRKMGDEAVLISKWVTPGNPENSKMYKSVLNGSMPKRADRLSDEEIAAIKSYILSLKP